MANFWEWSKDVSFVNRFIFPAPKPSSYNKDSFPEELLFVPPKEKLYKYYKQFKMEESNKNKGIPNNKYDLNSPKYNRNANNNTNNHYDNDVDETKINEKKQQYCDENAIPCIYIERKYRLSEATHLLLYLHGNAEDLGKCYPIIDYIRMKLQVNILAPEYPGYGVSSGEACENSVQAMVQNVYEFCISPYGLNIPPSRIIIYGFSIGSAAALSSSNLILRKVYLPDNYINNKSKKKKKKKKLKSIKNGNPLGHNIGDSSDSDSDEEESEDDDYDDDDNDDNNNNNNNNDNDDEEKKYEHDKLLNYKGNKQKSRKYFLSTFLRKCPHKENEHNILFDSDHNKIFYNSDLDNNEDGDPFERLPLASLLNILRKGNVQYPTSVNKKELLHVARKNGLIPPLNSCKKANVIRKYSLLIIVCPFASISQVVADKIGVFASYLLSERFKNIEAVKKVHGPLLIIHGKDDSIIPYQHSIEIHKTAQKCDIQPTHIELLDGCDHNTMDLRKITNIINKFFKHQFNLCKSQKRVNGGNNNHHQNGYNNGYEADDNNNNNLGHTPHSRSNNNHHSKSPTQFANGQPYPKTNHNNGRIINEFKVKIPNYCWLKPEQEAQELTEEDKLRMKKKQEQDDEEYAFNLFMKQLLQHESMQNAAASPLQAHQHKKLGKFFGDSSMSQQTMISTQSNSNIDHSGVVEENDINLIESDINDNDKNQVEPEYSLSQALRLPPHEIIVPPESVGDVSADGD